MTSKAVDASYPPTLPDEHLSYLINSVQDWQYQHGSLLKVPPKSGMTLARPIGVTLFPTLFPRLCFHEARNIQAIYNHLYAAVAVDEIWLSEVLKEYHAVSASDFERC